jgi:hypothetical protein
MEAVRSYGTLANFIRRHCITSQKITIFIVIAVRTSDLA